MIRLTITPHALCQQEVLAAIQTGQAGSPDWLSYKNEFPFPESWVSFRPEELGLNEDPNHNPVAPSPATVRRLMTVTHEQRENRLTIIRAGWLIVTQEIHESTRFKALLDAADALTQKLIIRLKSHGMTELDILREVPRLETASLRESGRFLHHSR